MKKVKRLYSEFKPERYELYLEPNREALTFSGKLKLIGRKTGRPSQRITLHQKGLKIKAATIIKHDKRAGAQPIKLDRLNTHSAYDELRLHTSQPIYSGVYEIEIEFSGKITEPMHGIYPCNFELNGQKKQLIATQFESHHAREAFPCIDEPEAKAVFSLSLKTPTNEIVIANTPVAKEEKAGSQKITSFQDSPIMSTYLLAFVYGELDYRQAKSKNGSIVRVYSTPDKIGLVDFALDVSVKSLEFFEDYFGVPYPLPKLDVIGLPDFSAGAMENWGLITFRESVLYVDPESTGIETKQYVAMVVAHEIAHQWFGNLVTMKWWNDLWLNESFANMMEYRAVDELFPEWKIWEEFTAREMGSALSRDALPTVQAVRTQVNHPDELSSLFDPSIVYAKGGTLLNMVRWLVGEAAFRKGLKSYFEEFKYANTEADDLWKHLGQASGFDIAEVMSNWLTKPGYPVLEINHVPASNEVEVTQSRLVIGANKQTSEVIWQVPLAPSQTLDQPLLKQASQEFKITKDSTQPLVFNQGARSYFVAKYANPKHFDSILSAVKTGSLSPIDRLLLAQSYTLMERASKVPTVENLKLLESYANEREDAVWSYLAGIIGSVRTLIGIDQELNDKLNNFVRPLIKPLVDEFGWRGQPGDSAQVQKIRAKALAIAAVSEDKAVIKHGLKLFADFKKPSDLPADIRSNVYFIGVRFGLQPDFDKLVKLYQTLNNSDEKDDIAAELTATRDPRLIKQLLGMITSPDVRLQDAPTWFAWLMRNRYATDLTWQWLQDNWAWVEEKYGDDKSYDRFPRYSAMTFSYPEQLAEFKKFFESKSNTALARPISLGVEEIEGRLAWRAKNEVSVKNWLNQAQ